MILRPGLLAIKRKQREAQATVESESAANTAAVADLLCVPTLAFCTDTITLFITFNLPPANTTLTPADWTITIGGTPQTAATAACSGGVVTLTASAGSFLPTSEVATSITVAYDGTDTTFKDQVGPGRAVPAFSGFVVLPRLDMVNSEYYGMKEASAPSTPASGYGRLYPATDGTLHYLNDAGSDGTLATTAQIPAAGHVIEDEGTPVTQRANLNFAGAGVSVADSGGKTVVTIAGGSGFEFPIGYILPSSVNTNPATFLGYGTWTNIGAGRVPVGLDSGDTDFDTALETGGAKTKAISAHSGATVSDHASHTHTYTETPDHVHVLNAFPTATGGSTGFTRDTSMSGTPAATGLSTNNPTGGVASGTTAGPSATLSHTVGQADAHTDLNVVQPYFVVYWWHRDS